MVRSNGTQGTLGRSDIMEGTGRSRKGRRRTKSEKILIHPAQREPAFLRDPRRPLASFQSGHAVALVL